MSKEEWNVYNRLSRRKRRYVRLLSHGICPFCGALLSAPQHFIWMPECELKINNLLRKGIGKSDELPNPLNVKVHSREYIRQKY